MLFSFWNRPWVKKFLTVMYALVIVVCSITFCYWTFKIDSGPELQSIKIVKVIPKRIEQTSCQSEVDNAREEFEKESTPANWLKWANLEQVCNALPRK